MPIRQNNGKLGKKRREIEFAALKDVEVAALEAIVQDAFDGFEGAKCACQPDQNGAQENLANTIFSVDPGRFDRQQGKIFRRLNSWPG
jgi:hypothetical protein